LPGGSGKDGGKQFGRVAPAIWAAAVEPADVRWSGRLWSRPRGIEQAAMTPISHALPVDPPPPRTNPRSPAARARFVASACG